MGGIDQPLVGDTLRESEARFRALFEQAAVGVAEFENSTGRFVRVNQRYADIVGYPREEMERLTFQEITHADDLAVGLATIANLTSGDVRAVSREKRYISKNGEIVWVSLEISPMHVPGMRSTHSIAVIQDITARKLTEDVQSFLAHSGYERSGVDFFDALVRRLAERLDMAYAFVHRLERAGTCARSEACFADGHRMDPVEYLLAGTPCGELLTHEVCSFPSGVQQLFPDDAVLAAWGIESYVGIRLQGYDGEPIGLLSLLGRQPLKRPLLAELALKLVAVRASGELERRRASERELVERARADAEHERLEVQLRQAQKMEAVGQLAGGVAHDFNNMLSVILGFTEEALLTLPPDAPASADLREVLTAATRSADLTRQLLAFARKQTIAPRRLDLNDAIAQMLTMLRRLIGEHLALVWRPAAGACLVHMDPGQIDQILTNLVINARDAIASTGTITIETTTVVVAAGSPRPHPDAVPGPYVVLTVRDDGCGIDEATRERIFEPFFTTKPQGQGTGLGLATVYGITRQNGGFIDLVTAPGRGSAFQVYLPATATASLGVHPAPKVQVVMARRTALLVEDEPAILALSRRMLERCGFDVLSTSNPLDAVALADAYQERIDLLITDVVMPTMSGVELFQRLRATSPAMKCLLISGYPLNVLARRGVLDPSVPFLPKPFTYDALVAKLQELLEHA